MSTATATGTNATTIQPLPSPQEIEKQLWDMRGLIETRIDALNQELAGVDAKIVERNELKGSLAVLLRVIDPEALPKRKRRSRAEVEAEKAAKAASTGNAPS